MLISTLCAQMLPLEIQGNNSIDNAKIYKVLGLHKPGIFEFYKKEPKFNEKLIQLSTETLKDFYKSYGFYHAKISFMKEKDHLLLKIIEGPPIKIELIKKESTINIDNSIPFKIGDVFNAEKFILSKQNVRSDYEKMGYCNAQYNIKTYIDIVKNSAHLIYKITSGNICFFKHITINNPKNIDKDIIKPLLYIKKGKIYTPKSIKKSYKRLYAYDGISEVQIHSSIDKGNDVNATITIKSNPKPIQFQIGFGASSDEGLTAKLDIKHRNFFGNLKTLALHTRVTQIKQTFGVDFSMPLTNGNISGSKISYDNENFFSFKEYTINVKGFLKQINEPISSQEALIIDSSTTYDSNDILIAPETTLLIVSPALKWKYDTRDDILNPKKGYFIDASLQGSLKCSISDASYYKAKISTGIILPLEPSILALKIDLGSLHTFNGNVPSSYRFFAGGMYSNRAYRYRFLGPKDKNGDPVGFNFLMDTTVEYRFNIVGDFNGVVFNDNSFIGESYSPNTTNGYYSGGVGVRYETPIGPLAIDFGFDLKQPKLHHAFHFHIGESF